MNYNKLNCIWRGSEKKSLYTEKKKNYSISGLLSNNFDYFE